MMSASLNLLVMRSMKQPNASSQWKVPLCVPTRFFPPPPAGALVAEAMSRCLAPEALAWASDPAKGPRSSVEIGERMSPAAPLANGAEQRWSMLGQLPPLATRGELRRRLFK